MRCVYALVLSLVLRACGAAAEATNLTGAVFTGHWFDAALWQNGSLSLRLSTTPTRVAEVDDVRGYMLLGAAASDGAAEEPAGPLAAEVRLVIDGGVLVRSAGAERGELRLQLTSSLLLNTSEADTEEAHRAALAAAARSAEARARLVSDDGTLRRRCAFTLVGRLEEGGSDGWGGPPELRLLGELASADCGLALRVDCALQRRDALLEKGSNAALLGTAAALALISLMARQLEAASQPAALARISAATAAHLAVLDAEASLAHLTVAMQSEALFGAFAFAALCFLLLFSALDMRLLSGVWRARLPPEAGWAEARAALRAMHVRMYLGMAVANVAALLLRAWPAPLLLAAHSFWVGQIAHSARLDAPRPLRSRFVWGSSVARLLLPLYLLACPRNALRLAPRPGLAAALAGWVLLQAATLQAQAVWGARFFLPARFHAQRYDYGRAAGAAERAAAGWGEEGAEGAGEAGEAGGPECVICSETLPWEAVGARAAARSITPCGHFFHQRCLGRWLEVKLQCPTCRGGLPLP